MEGFTVKCPKCQFDNREGVKFCEECGDKFEVECPACKIFLLAENFVVNVVML
jgi:predicted amidophosphoribosyltransferase